MRLEFRPGDGGDDAALFASELSGSVEKFLSANGCSVRRASDGTRTTTLDVVGDRRWL